MQQRILRSHEALIKLFFAGLALLAAQLGAAAEPGKLPKASDVLKPEKIRPIASPISDHFALRGSFFSAKASTDMRLDRSNGALGTELNAENDLALEDKPKQGRVELLFRLRDRHRLRVDYFGLDRKGDTVLTRSIAFGDETFLVSDRVLSELDWRMLNFTYLYSALRSERFELGAGLGVHVINAEARGRVPARLLIEEQSGVGASPALALDATWRISRRFAVTGRAQYFSVAVSDFASVLRDYHADVQYRWRRNAALGLGYTRLRTQLDVTDTNDLSGRFDIDVKGPELFFRVSF